MLLSVLLVACNNKSLLDETHQISNANWERFQTETFKFNVPDADECYDIYLYVDIDTARFVGSMLPVAVNLYSVQGERRMFRTDIAVRSNDGKWLGEVADGKMICSKKIRSTFFFNRSGENSMELSQCSNRYDMQGVNALRLQIEVANFDLPK